MKGIDSELSAISQKNEYIYVDLGNEKSQKQKSST